MKTKTALILLCLPIIAWMLLIFTLSSQNGEQTVKNSEGIANIVAEVVFQQPTEQQVDWVHLTIRKSAHISLFFILGVISCFAAITTLGRKNKKQRVLCVLIATVLTTAYGFFDEWHKQFIDGRHFQVDEAILNIICGVAGTLSAMIVAIVFAKMKRPSKKRDT